jgi:hypothetical protein
MCGFRGLPSIISNVRNCHKQAILIVLIFTYFSYMCQDKALSKEELIIW